MSANKKLKDICSNDLIKELEYRCEMPLPEIDAFDTEELIEELKTRGYTCHEEDSWEEKIFFSGIYQKLISGENYEPELHSYLKELLGKAL